MLADRYPILYRLAGMTSYFIAVEYGLVTGHKTKKIEDLF